MAVSICNVKLLTMIFHVPLYRFQDPALHVIMQPGPYPRHTIIVRGHTIIQIWAAINITSRRHTR